MGPLRSSRAGYENVQGAESRGLELGLQARLGSHVRAGLSYTFLHTEVSDDGGLESSAFVEGEPLLRRPRHSGSFFLAFASERLDARLGGTVVGSRLDRDFGVIPEVRVRNPGYVKLDLSASYRIYRHPGTGAELRLRGVVENLLDEDFEEAFGFPAPGLEARGGLELRL